MEKKYDIFISYRRTGGDLSAKIIRDKLREMGYRVFFDVESLKSGNFNEKLYSVIDECKDFLLILSPGALDRCVNADGTPNDRDWVRKELAHALKKGKNVIPIMLNGFVMPDMEEANKLPEDIRSVCMMNGIAPNPTDFDTKMDRLCRDFLQSKPYLIISAGTFFTRKILPVTAAFLLLAVLLVCVRLLAGSGGDTFPKTDNDKSTVSEVLYYVQKNMTGMDLMAGAMKSAMQTTRRYLNSGGIEYSTLSMAYKSALNTLQECDLSNNAPSDSLIERVGSIKGTPINVDDMAAVYDYACSFKQSWAGSLAYMQWVMEQDSFYTASTKMNILDCYETMLDEELSAIACGTNELLADITNEKVMEDFWYDFLPLLTNIKLSAVSWSRDRAALNSEMDACFNRMESAMNDLTALVGNTANGAASLRAYLISNYMSLGYTREQAETLVEAQLYLADKEQAVAEKEKALDETRQRFRELITPTEGDSEEQLWEKLAFAVEEEEYDIAADCVEAIDGLVSEKDPNAAVYIPVLKLFLDNAPVTGINYGVLVYAFGEETDTPYQIGDIIIELDGKICYTLKNYLEAKEKLEAEDYRVAVLRRNNEGKLERVELNMNLGMSPVYLRSLSSRGAFD